jgi:hypothetical protein
MLQAEGVYPPAPRVRDVAFPEPINPFTLRPHHNLFPPTPKHTNTPPKHFPVSSPYIPPKRTFKPNLNPTPQPSLLPPPQLSRFAHSNPFQPLSNDAFPPDPSHPSDFVSHFCLTSACLDLPLRPVKSPSLSPANVNPHPHIQHPSSTGTHHFGLCPCVSRLCPSLHCRLWLHWGSPSSLQLPFSPVFLQSEAPTHRPLHSS